MPTSLWNPLPFNRTLNLAQMQLRVLCEQVKSGNWSTQLQGVTRRMLGEQGVEGHMLHPCLVNNRSTLVHAADLRDRDPEFYTRLQAFAEGQGYVLLADRRRQDIAVLRDRRRKWLPVLIVSMGLSSYVLAADRLVAGDQPQAAEQTLALFDSPLQQSQEEYGSEVTKSEATKSPLLDAIPQPNEVGDDARSPLAADIESILRRHYKPGKGDPEYIRQDIKLMADYFARYPEVVGLIQSLQDQAWQLNYARDTFETRVRGSQIQVKAVTVKFDTRAAAQLRNRKGCAAEPGACIASPADALLHELLHAQIALLHPQEFIAEGGLNSVMYPYEHERAVIRRENALYKSMSALDGAYRPSRHSHSGHIVASACVTCLSLN